MIIIIGLFILPRICMYNVWLQFIRRENTEFFRDNNDGGHDGCILHISESSELLALQNNVLHAGL